jgi:hypothetical protein
MTIPIDCCATAANGALCESFNSALFKLDAIAVAFESLWNLKINALKSWIKQPTIMVVLKVF